MKSSNGVLFAAILIVAFVSLFGFGYTFYLFNCAKLVSDWHAVTAGTSESIEKMEKVEAVCDWNHQFNDPKETRNEGLVFFGGTLLIDSVVLIAYGLSANKKKIQHQVEKNI